MSETKDLTSLMLSAQKQLATQNSQPMPNASSTLPTRNPNSPSDAPSDAELSESESSIDGAKTPSTTDLTTLETSKDLATTDRVPTTPQGLACQQRYETPKRFLELFNPSHQEAYTEDEDRAYAGNAPSLNAVADAFERRTAILWISIQIRDLSEFVGTKERMTAGQIQALARQMYATCRYWRVTVLMHFFQRVKGGCYGKFYGAVDPLQISECLQRFVLYKQEREYQIDLSRRVAKKQAEDAAHAAAVRRHVEHLQRLGITQQQWMENMDVFMDGPRERCLPEDVERRMLTERGVLP